MKNATLAKALLIGLLGLMPISASSQDANEKAPAPEKASPSEADSLAFRQSQIADKYARLERLMFRMAEIEASSNPARAKLLKQAIAQSKEKLTLSQLKSVVRQLQAERAPSRRVVDGQAAVQSDMQALLELLLRESRSDRIRSEQARIREYIKEVEKLMRLERSLRGRAEGGDDAAKLAKDQGKVATRTDNLAKKIKENEEGGQANGGEGGDSQGKSEGDSQGKSEGDSKGKSEGDSKGNSEGDSKGKSEGDSKGKSEGDSKGKSEGDSKGKSEGDSKGKSEGDSKGKSEGDSKGKSEGDSKGKSEGDSKGKSEGDSKGKSEGDSKGNSEGDSKGNSEGDSKGNSEGDSKGNSQGDSKGDSQGDSKGGKSGDPSAQDENPARKRIQEAEKKMREAQQKLEQARREEAVDAQQKALEELEKAKAELEEILRQLREEEVERVLAMLEGRFRRMLEKQLKIYESTVSLDKIPQGSRNRQVDIRAGKLAFEEKKLVIEADRAYQLLVEEGSSIAFPETVDQLREDMAQISSRLAATKVGRITRGLEEDVIRTLEELIEALKKAQQEMEDQKNDGQPPPPGQPTDMPLVDQIAELKMIRSLQVRVNTRTKRYARYLDDEDDPTGQATDEDLSSSIKRLSDREQSIFKITRDIVLGKNK